MKSASPNLSAMDNVIDVSVVGDKPQEQHYSPPPSSSSAITTSNQGSFSSFLVPLNKDSFKEVVRDVEDKLKVVNQTLGMLDNLLDSQGFDAILNEMLQSITLKTGELLNADRSTIFLLDDEKMNCGRSLLKTKMATT